MSRLIDFVVGILVSFVATILPAVLVIALFKPKSTEGYVLIYGACTSLFYYFFFIRSNVARSNCGGGKPSEASSAFNSQSADSELHPSAVAASSVESVTEEMEHNAPKRRFDESATLGDALTGISSGAAIGSAGPEWKEFYFPELKFLDETSGFLSSNKVRRIQSFSDPQTVYKINLAKLECSCDDFEKRRRVFRIYDPRRLCKHLSKVLSNSVVWAEQSSLYKAVAESRMRATRLLTMRYGSDLFVVFNYDLDNEWVGVVVLDKMVGVEAEVFSFHRSQRRWSYGVSPRRSPVIQSFILEKLYQGTTRWGFVDGANTGVTKE